MGGGRWGRPLLESLPKCKTSVLMLLRSDQWFASGDFVIVHPTESKLLMGTLQFGLLLSSLLSDCREQSLREGFIYWRSPKSHQARRFTCWRCSVFLHHFWPLWFSGGKTQKQHQQAADDGVLQVHSQAASFTNCLWLWKLKKNMLFLHYLLKKKKKRFL